MKHAFIVKLTMHSEYGNIEIEMPWMFTTMKEACLYGEWTYRKDKDCVSYRLKELIKPCRFYALKEGWQ